jgi:polyhydroxyalkanoate synthesis regulator phasin
MILRTLALAGGLSGALGASQFPEFSQQYMQRLGGAVDELTRQVDRYTADAAEVDMDLREYLVALAAEGDLAARQARNMLDDVQRRERLAGDLAALEGAGPFMRAKLATHLGDREIARAAMEAFKPAVPVTFEGATFAGTGFLAVWLGLGLVFGFLKRLWYTVRPRQRPRQRQSRRREPVV